MTEVVRRKQTRIIEPAPVKEPVTAPNEPISVPVTPEREPVHVP